jgi:metallo-beta-lactamase class B
MKKLIPFLLAVLILLACNNPQVQEENNNNYESEDLIVRKLSDHVYQHTSYLSTQDFGKVVCNGMIVLDNNEAIVFDTPTDDKVAQELINWITNNLESKITGVVATHFHADCLGGLNEFHKNNIPSYANNSTIEFAKTNKSAIPQHGFTDSLILNVGNEEVYLWYFSEGHTKDNIIAYFPSDKLLFGGCLIKEVGANKGNLEDANPEAWSHTVQKLKNKYPDVKTIIPGHGELGGKELLDYTINLFEN